MTIRDDTLDLILPPSGLEGVLPASVWIEQGNEHLEGQPDGEPEVGVAWASARDDGRPNTVGALLEFLRLGDGPDGDFVSFLERRGEPGDRDGTVELREGVWWYPIRRMRRIALRAQVVLNLAADLRRRLSGSTQDWAEVLEVTGETILSWRRAGGDWWNRYLEEKEQHEFPDVRSNRELRLCMELWVLLHELGFPTVLPVWEPGQRHPRLRMHQVEWGLFPDLAVQLVREFLGERAETGLTLQSCAGGCGAEFVPTRSNHIFCGPTCRNRVSQRRRRAGVSRPRSRKKAGPRQK